MCALCRTLNWISWIFELNDMVNVLLHIVCQLMSDCWKFSSVAHLSIGIETVLSWCEKILYICDSNFLGWNGVSFNNNGGV